MDSPQNDARSAGGQDDASNDAQNHVHNQLSDSPEEQSEPFAESGGEVTAKAEADHSDANRQRQIRAGSTNQSEAAPLDYTNLTGRQIGRYRIEQQIGSGGVAVVYQAYDQVQGIPVALKVLMPNADEKTYGRFRREALTAGGLHFEHIVRIRQVGTLGSGGLAYMAMELVDGESLSDLLNTHGKLHPEESCNLLEPIARALSHAHQAGIVHRDVKPSNILLRTASPGAPHSVQLQTLEYPVVPLLSDFGVARYLDAPELTNTGRTVGTPAYMAPEQCAGNRDVDGRADIYALGCVLYRCVTGRPPFAGSVTQILHAHVYEPLAIENDTLQRLPPVLVEILQRSLAKRPEDRYASADEMARALAFAAGRTTTAPRPNQSDATSTLTLEAAPLFSPPTQTTSTTVLVPGVQGAQTSRSQAGPNQTQRTQTTRTRTGGNPLTARSLSAVKAVPAANVGAPPLREEKFYRLVWIILPIALAVLIFAFVLAMMGSPFGLGRGDGVGSNTVLPSPTLAFGGGVPTFTPTPNREQGGEPTASPGAVLSVTPVSTVAGGGQPPPDTGTDPTETPPFTPSPTWTPSWTPTPPPSLTPTATWTPTNTPTPTLTATLTPLPSATWTPEATATLTPEVVDTATPLPPTTCSAAPDQVWTSFVTSLDPSTQQGFVCAFGPAVPVNVERLDFQYGYMLRMDSNPNEIYVLYNGDSRWETVPINGAEEAPPLPTDIVPGPDFYLPDGIFGSVWADERIREALGSATAPQPESYPGKLQTFPGGVLIYNFVDGQVRAFFADRQL